jgi:hypothetical protein
MPLPGRAVFYHGEEGTRRAREFVLLKGDGFTRIDELLAQTALGKELLAQLVIAKESRWDEIEEVWWELSRKLARNASGDVYCFGPERRLTDRGAADAFRSRFRWYEVPDPVSGKLERRYAFADTIFDKVELPELENNDRVCRIFYNGIELP